MEAAANAQTVWSNGGNRVQSQRTESYHRQQWAGHDPALAGRDLNPFQAMASGIEEYGGDAETREVAAKNNRLRRTLYQSQSAAPRQEAQQYEERRGKVQVDMEINGILNKGLEVDNMLQKEREELY